MNRHIFSELLFKSLNLKENRTISMINWPLTDEKSLKFIPVICIYVVTELKIWQNFKFCRQNLKF